MIESTQPYIVFLYISLIFGIWSLLLGIFTLSFVHQIFKRHRKLFLRWYFKYIFFVNFSVIIFQIVAYLQSIEFLSSTYLVRYAYIFAVMISTFALVSATYFFIKLIAILNSTHYPFFLKKVIVLLSIFFLCNYFIGIYFLFKDNALNWYIITDYSLYGLALLVSFIILFYYTFYVLKDRKSVSIKATLSFFYFYLIFYISSVVLLFLPSNICYYSVFMNLIFFNLIPLIWIPKYYLKFIIIAVPESDLLSSIEIISQYNITKREREIIELILSGKSNNEISETLFISENTVRNHIYRIYKKMDINSRGQLLNLILELQ